MAIPLRSIRLIGRTSTALDRASGDNGEIFFDSDNLTLRLSGRSNQQSSILASRTWVTANTFNGNYNSLTNKPSLATVATSGSYADLSNKPSLFSGSYNDLSDKPTIPESVSLTGYATESYVTTAISNIPAVDFTGLATEAFVGTAISNLVDSAPTTLNTLNELAAALGDDANYATTITTAIGLKAPLADPAFTGTVSGVTATHVGLGNVTNESKVTMFTNPTFTYNGTNAIINFTSEGLAIVRGGLTLDDSNGSSATRISFRDTSGQLGYIDTIGEYNTYPNNTSGIGFYTGIGTLGLSITENKGIQFHRAAIESCEIDGGISGVVDYDFQGSPGVYYIIEPTGNITPNFTNLHTATPYTFTTAFVIEQGATAYIPNALQIAGSAQSIIWQGGSTPTGTANGVDIVSFTLIRVVNGPTGSWTVLGSLTNYG